MLLQERSNLRRIRALYEGKPDGGWKAWPASRDYLPRWGVPPVLFPEMKTDYTFTIFKGQGRAERRGWVAMVTDEAAYSELKAIAMSHWGDTTPPEYQNIMATVSESDPHLPEFFKILNRCGWTPYFGEIVPEELRKDHFYVRRFRRYEKADLDKAEYLSVFRWGMGAPPFSWEEIRDGRYVLRTAKARGKTRYGHPSGWNRQIDTPPFVNGELKRDLEQAGLKGLCFKPVIYDNPKKARGEFWQMDSTVTLPPCLLPLVSIGDSWSPNMPPYPMEDYDDGGHLPQELVYERAAVERLEPFDIAFTRERTRVVSPDCWGRRLIVSQRARQVMKKLKMGTVEFARVVLK